MKTFNLTIQELDELQPAVGVTIVTPKLDPEYLESKLEAEDAEADICG